LAVGVEALLKFLKPGNNGPEDWFHVVDVGRKAEALGRIVRGESEMPRLIDPAMFENFRKLHFRLA